jgi:predicted DCC family thiol-disulfide oxidoreductase YuxK
MGNSAAPVATPHQLVIVYDGNCPVCSAYVRFLRLQQAIESPLLVNARGGGEWVEKVRAAGLNLDTGMAAFVNGRWYHGADCVHVLALLSTPVGLFNRLNAALFRNARTAAICYPAMRAGRNLLLRLLGRSSLQL